MDPTASAPVRTVQWRLRGHESLPFAAVRRLVLIALVVLAGCGGSATRENRLRPAPPVTLTAAIHDDTVQVSPRSVGAGTIVLLVSNQSGAPQTVTVETDDRAAGNRASSPEIAPRATGRVTIDARRGTYVVHVGDDSIKPARLRIGAPRRSSQDRVLLP
jgi:hypothetical protein